MRLIDADALRKEMYHEAFETDSELQKWDSGCWIRWKMFENFIQKAPIVDAVPVKHGRWIKGGYACGENEYKCSACGETEWRTGCKRMKYCMYCGAKMDLEGQDADNI